jgi:hypothetical protein
MPDAEGSKPLRSTESPPSADPDPDTALRGRFTRRGFMRLVGGAGVVGGAAYLGVRAVGGSAPQTRTPGSDPGIGGAQSGSTPSLDEVAEAVVSGGPPKDGIPPIDEPRFVNAADAGFLTDDDVVFGLVRDRQSRAYPQLVLVWHEIVNDTFPSGPLTVTYCPLTGSTVAFSGTAPDGTAYTFGTSGDLVNSNLLMYDRQTDSRWPQILAQAITGDVEGAQLTEEPLVWTTWSRWRQAHPETEVLSTETGYLRDYGSDPYGSYTPLDGYYAPASRRLFPVLREDERFDPKEVVIGAKHGGAQLAVPKSLLRERGVAHASLEGERVVALYDHDVDDGRVFRAHLDGADLELERGDEAGIYRDATTGSLFDAEGQAVAGPLADGRLEAVVFYDVMWFAWYAFFPDTEVVT